jgi:hypothetical protein
MNTRTKLGAYVAGLGLVFAGAIWAGSVAGPAAGTTEGPAHEEMSNMTQTTGSAHASSDHDAGAGGAAAPKGLTVSQDGYTLTPVTTSLPAETRSTYTFRIVGPDGRPVTDYRPTHDKNLHLIVVRRDLSGFAHVHPRMADDGTWSVPLQLTQAGSYRVFADFAPAGHVGDALTLGADLQVSGAYELTPLPAPARTATVDGYTVTLDGELLVGQASPLTLSVRKDGKPVTDLQPYLAAYGHLVALRDGDLAYLHVHPDGEPGDGRTAAGPDIRFYAEVPTAGTYRLYLDFQHQGTVRTAEFTATAGLARDGTSPPTTTAPTTGEPSGHSH